MGAPSTEKGRTQVEWMHLRRIGRSFAVFADWVTKEQFLTSRPDYWHSEMMKRFPDPTCPIGGVSWHEAAEYCNWLSKQETIAWPVHNKKPNDFGLFDMQGNLMSWCQNGYYLYPRLSNAEKCEDVEEALAIDPQQNRMVRGSSFNSRALYARSRLPLLVWSSGTQRRHRFPPGEDNPLRDLGTIPIPEIQGKAI